MTIAAALLPDHRTGRALVDLEVYDRSPVLTAAEKAILTMIAARRARPPRLKRWPLRFHRLVDRLLGPLKDVLAAGGCLKTQRTITIGLVVSQMHRLQRAYWGWTHEQWKEVLQRCPQSSRQQLVAIAYLLDLAPDLYQAAPGLLVYRFACRVFGAEAVDASVARVREEFHGWGHRAQGISITFHSALSLLLLHSRSPHLESITPEVLTAVQAGPLKSELRHSVVVVARVLVALGLLPKAAAQAAETWPGDTSADEGVPMPWLEWCRRWRSQSPLLPTRPRWPGGPGAARRQRCPPLRQHTPPR